MSNVVNRYSEPLQRQGQGYNLCQSHGGGRNERELLQNFVLSKLSRKELEDRFCNIDEKNIILKRQINSKDEKLKLLGTKLLRLTQQQKKDSTKSEYYKPLEKILQEQALQIEHLQNINKSLNENMNILKRQICAQKCMLSSVKGSISKNSDGLEPYNKSGKFQFNVISIDKSEYEPSENKRKSSTAPNDNDLNTIQEDANSLNNSNNANEETIINNNKNDIKPPCTSFKKDDAPDSSYNGKSTESNKTQPSVRDFEIQTSMESVLKKTVYDDISQQLAQERMLVLDLQQQLKSAKLNQRVVNEVEELLRTLNEKRHSKERENENNPKDKHVDSESVTALRQELQGEKFELEMQKKNNLQLLLKMSEMQNELDAIKIKSMRVSSTKNLSPHQALNKKEVEATHASETSKHISPSKRSSLLHIKQNAYESIQCNILPLVINIVEDLIFISIGDLGYQSYEKPIKQSSYDNITSKIFNTIGSIADDLINENIKNLGPPISSQVDHDEGHLIEKSIQNLNDISQTSQVKEKNINDAAQVKENSSKSINYLAQAKEYSNSRRSKSDVSQIKEISRQDINDVSRVKVSRQSINGTLQEVQVKEKSRQSIKDVGQIKRSGKMKDKKQNGIVKDSFEINKEKNLIKQKGSKTSDAFVNSSQPIHNIEAELSAHLEKTVENVEVESSKSIDDATYDVSNDNTLTSDSSKSLDSSYKISNEDLSDGEIPRNKDTMQSIHNVSLPGSSLPTECQPTSIESKAQSTLDAISKELDTCTKLLCSKDSECQCDHSSKK